MLSNALITASQSFPNPAKFNPAKLGPKQPKVDFRDVFKPEPLEPSESDRIVRAPAKSCLQTIHTSVMLNHLFGTKRILNIPGSVIMEIIWQVFHLRPLVIIVFAVLV